MVDNVRQDSVVLAVVLKQRGDKVAVKLTDGLQRNALRAHRGTLTDVGAATKSLSVVLSSHRLDAAHPLRLTLRKHGQVSDLRRGEQH